MTTAPKKSPSYRSHDRDLLPLVFLILEQVNGDVGAAIEFLIAEQGAEECSANSDPLSTNTYATGLELRGLGVWLQWRQGCIRVPLCLWASYFPREYDGACLQMRMPYSPAAHLFLFLVQSTDYNLVGALGLLRILIYKVYVDGTTTMSTHERKTSIREFYAVIYPSLLQLQKGVTNNEDKKIEGCMHGEVLSKRWDNYHVYT